MHGVTVHRGFWWFPDFWKVEDDIDIGMKMEINLFNVMMITDRRRLLNVVAIFQQPIALFVSGWGSTLWRCKGGKIPEAGEEKGRVGKAEDLIAF